MSQANVEIGRRSTEAFNRGGVEAMLPFLHEDVEWVSVDQGPLAPSYRGHDGVRQFYADVEDVFEEMEQTLEDVIDAGGDQIVGLTRFRARGKGSDLALDEAWAFVGTVCDGKLIRVEAYTDRSRALEAVGLSE